VNNEANAVRKNDQSIDLIGWVVIGIECPSGLPGLNPEVIYIYIYISIENSNKHLKLRI
jgi:hypothetical protein